jgi:hypothetical protein
VYAGHLRRYRFVFIISGTLRKRIRSVKKKRDVDFCKENFIRQLIYRKYSKGRIEVMQ